MAYYATVEEMVSKILGQSYRVIPVEIDDPNGLGSVQLRYMIESTIGQDQGISKWIFVKKNDLESDVTKLLHVAEKECMMYNEIIPLMFDFLKKQNLQLANSLISIFPKIYGHGYVGSNIYFLFEDFSCSRDEEFKVSARDSFHDDKTVHTVMKRIAQFHGAFHALKAIKKINFKEEFPLTAVDFLTEEDCHSFLFPFYDGMFRQALTMLQIIHEVYSTRSSALVMAKISLSDRQVSSLGDLLQKLQQLIPDTLKMLKNVNARVHDKLSIPIHGDFYPLNIAASSTDVVFFDFQLSRCTDGMIDVHQYLCQGTTTCQRASHLPDFLKTYHDTLTDTCKLLGLPGSPYGNMEGFLATYKVLSPWQALFGFAFPTWKHVHDNTAFGEYSELVIKYRSSRDDNLEQNKNKIISCIDRLGPKIWDMVQMLCDFVIEMEDSGIIEELSKLENH